MGRPLSPTGSVMDEAIVTAEMALCLAEKAAVFPLMKRMVDPVEWAGAMGDVINELRKARLAVAQVRSIVDDNKRRGRYQESE